MVVLGFRPGRERVRLGLRADFREIVTVGVEGRLPGAGADWDEVEGSREELEVGGSGCGGCERRGSTYYEIVSSRSSAVDVDKEIDGVITYWYPCLESLWVEDMVRLVLGGFAVEGGEELLRELDLAHVLFLLRFDSLLVEAADESEGSRAGGCCRDWARGERFALCWNRYYEKIEVR